jgi:ATP-dependent protease ClpP protease subunit
MTKYHYISSGIETETVQRLLEVINYMTDQDQLLIIMDTGGGSLPAAEIICDLVNTDPRVFIHYSNNIFSAGFWMFLNTNPEKSSLAFNTSGMWHLGRCTVETGTSGKPYFDGDIALVNHLKTMYKSDLKVGQVCDFSPDEMKKLKNSESVYLTPKRVRKIAKTLGIRVIKHKTEV